MYKKPPILATRPASPVTFYNQLYICKQKCLTANYYDHVIIKKKSLDRRSGQKFDTSEY